MHRVNSENLVVNDSRAKGELSPKSRPSQAGQPARLRRVQDLSRSDRNHSEGVVEISPAVPSEERVVGGSEGSPKFRSRARVKAAVMYALSSIIPFLVLLYIIHVAVFSGKGMNVVWVSCLALIALGIAMLGWKLMKEAWGKLSHAVETIEDLRGESDHLNHALRMKEGEDEIDRIPFVVNHLAEIAKQQRFELDGYKIEVETLSNKVEEADRELQKLSREDRLTALYNPNYFGDRAGHEVARTRRYERDLALAMIEVDSFKEHKENAGHRAANKTLCRIGAIIRKSIRETDLPFRVGDDQFAIVFPETTAANATRALERIRVTAESLRVKKGGSHPNGAVTLSIGVSMMRKGCRDLEQFVAAADEALQKAKAAGGNRLAVL